MPKMKYIILLASQIMAALLFSAMGIKIGHRFGEKHRKRATIFGGAVLVIMAVKILLE
ncbi:MAG: manganese efflux pump, partial [Bacteroidales bacterium]|nr:manganese efflux pump [Bacteroidales bacterium]